MAGFRAHIESLENLAAGGFAFLPEGESRHLCGALRAQKGDIVDVFDLSEFYLRCEISEASPKKTQVKILEKRAVKRAGEPVILAQCMPKGGTFEDIISTAIQLGATAIFPIISERTIVRFSGASEADKKLEKWRARIIEAVKQSSNLAALKISAPMKLEDFLKGANSLLPEKCARLVASLELENPKPILSALEDLDPAGACVLIGPEGDLSEGEYKAAYAAGFAPVSLGESVMKCGVAAGYSMSVCSAYFLKKAFGSGTNH
ncbi:MAG: 16S rRNA (uracil(1498)-N(3))-methyltransferase [Opitutales bacterium]|nr:16S rRNA (uracil(1498)-N(3))-methyltransferase [Opitutales bacterium]